MNEITPAPGSEQWDATVDRFRAYLRDCNQWLVSQAHKESETKGVKATSNPSVNRDSGLPRDAAGHRSTFVYLKAA